MTTELEIIGVKDIMELYGFSWNYAYELVKQKGCPVLPRARNQKIRVVRSEFEAWMKGQRQK